MTFASFLISHECTRRSFVSRSTYSSTRSALAISDPSSIGSSWPAATVVGAIHWSRLVVVVVDLYSLTGCWAAVFRE